MKTLNINGVVFEVTKPRDLVRAHQRWLDRYCDTSKNINDCYNSPSHLKELIYVMWLNWWKDSITKKCFEEHNTMMFTIVNCVTIDGIDYLMEITPSHNKLIQCSCQSLNCYIYRVQQVE